MFTKKSIDSNMWPADFAPYFTVSETSIPQQSATAERSDLKQNRLPTNEFQFHLNQPYRLGDWGEALRRQIWYAGWVLSYSIMGEGLWAD